MIRVGNSHGAPGRLVRERRRFTPATLVRVGALVVLLAIAVPRPTLAHDGFTGIIVDPPRINPGGVVVIRGDQVATDDEVRIVLIGATGQTELAAAVTDGEGHFTVGPTIPPETPVGTYAIEVTGLSGVRMTAGLQVDGSPVFDGENGAPAGRDEGLPGVPSVPAPGSVPAGATPDRRATAPASDVDVVPFVALAGAIGGFALFVRWSRRPPPAAAGSTDLP